jgi:hypothetical protein
VELAYATNSEISPLAFQGKHINPRRGDLVSINFDVPSQGNRVYDRREPVPLQLTANDLADMRAGANRDKDLYNNDLLHLELARIHARFRVQPPKNRVVFANLPTIHGGPREIDSEQVRILIDWLASRYLGWYDEAAIERAAPAELKNQAKDLGAVVRQNRERTAELNGIAVALEKAPG